MAEGVTVAALARTVAGFHLTDKRLRAAQARIETALAAGEPSPADVRAYVSAVRAYFVPYVREAQEQLQHVDRELARLYQVQFNLTAERGVVQKRLEATQDVVASLGALES